MAEGTDVILVLTEKTAMRMCALLGIFGEEAGDVGFFTLRDALGEQSELDNPEYYRLYNDMQKAIVIRAKRIEDK